MNISSKATKTKSIIKKATNRFMAVSTALVLMAAPVSGCIYSTQTEAAKKSDYEVNVALYTKECCDEWSWNNEDGSEWTEPQTDSINITTDGRFSLKLTDLEIPSDKLCLCYIKDADVYANKIKKSNLPKDIKITTESVIVNGESLPIADGVRTKLYKKAFDVAYHNDWNDPDNVVDFTAVETVESIEVIFTVEGLGGEYATNIEETQAPATSDNATSDTSASSAVNSATDSNTSSESSSPVVPIVVAAVVVIGVVAVVIVKKRK